MIDDHSDRSPDETLAESPSAGSAAPRVDDAVTLRVSPGSPEPAATTAGTRDPRAGPAATQFAPERAHSPAATVRPGSGPDSVGDPRSAVTRVLSDETIIDPAGAALRAAVRIPGYEVLGELGRGGMGVVYKARQIGLNRIVALKMILAGAHAGPPELARFRLEAEVVAKVAHPNIVQIYDVGEVEGVRYYSLEYVDGGGLDGRLDGTPWKPATAAALIETLARAVHAAHRLGIIHRDLKPANVLIAGDGTPKIADFGLAKRIDCDDAHTTSGSIMGSPSYMAPEQASGDTKSVGPLADVYGLGAILYELLTGRPPFRAATPLDTMMQVISVEPVAPSRLQPGLPRDIETICLKCLQKERARRYADAQQLADDLGRFLAGEPIHARPVGPIHRVVKWVRRRPTTAALVLLVFCVAALGFSGVVWQWRRAERQKSRAEHQFERAERQRLRAEDQRSKALELSALAQRETQRAEQALSSLAEEKSREDAQFYAARVGLASQEWRAGNITRAKELLGQCPTRYRGWEWNYLSSLCDADDLTLRGHSKWVMRVRYSADGRRIASMGTDQTVRIWDSASGTLLKTFTTNGEPVALGPDGRMSATTNGSRILIWDVERGGPPRALEPGPGEAARSISFADLFASDVVFRPDGLRLAAASTDHQVHIWNVETGAEAVRLKGHPDTPTAVAYSPDGKQIATCSLLGDRSGNPGPSPGALSAVMWLSDAETGALLQRWDVTGFGVHRLAFTPDGRVLAGAGFDGIIHLWDPKTGARRASFAGHKGFIYGLAFSPDGRRLASGSWDRTVKLWDVESTRELAIFRGHEQYIMDVAFRPDGRQLASCGLDATVKVWDLEPLTNRGGAGETPTAGETASDGELTQEFRTLRGHTMPVQAVAFSPDGRRLATAGWDGAVRIWDVNTHRTVRTFRGHTTGVSTAEFRRDGKRIVSASGGSMGFGSGEVKVWDPDTGREYLTVHSGAGAVSAARFSPDGTRIASAIGGLSAKNRGEIRVWDAATGHEVAQMPGVKAAVMALAFAPDGRTVASVGVDPGVRIWDAATGKPMQPPIAPTLPFRAVAYSPDGALIAAAAFHGPISVWEARTGREVWRFAGHNMGPAALAFEPNGRRLASAGADASAKIWDLQNGLELLALRHHSHEVYGVAFDPDGGVLATAGFDAIVRLYSSRKSPLPKTSDWPVVFTDDFNRADIGKRWSVATGAWSIENGALRGTIDRVPGDIDQAAIYASGLALSDHVEVRFECWSPGPMVVETKLVDEPHELGLLALLVGESRENLNDGEMGALLMTRNSGFRPIASENTFVFRPGTHYRVRVLREPTRLTLVVDDVVIVSAPIPALRVPELRLQASWARPGSVLYFDNVEVRAPRTPAKPR
jgi:WD40 repeat protein/serine/threonine protein kinase